MVLLGLARVLAVEKPTKVESRVAAVVWLAQRAPRSIWWIVRLWIPHCLKLPIQTDAALPGASWLRDLRNLRRTEHADLGNPGTQSGRLDAWQDPDGREQQR